MRSLPPFSRVRYTQPFTAMTKRDSILIPFVATWLVVCAVPLYAETQSGEGAIVDAQQRLSEKYTRLELLAGRLAELSGSTRTRRARVRREVV